MSESARLRSWWSGQAGRLAALPRVLGEVWSGATGGDTYANYLGHLHNHHADTVPLSRADFFRREQDERWEGVRRCC